MAEDFKTLVDVLEHSTEAYSDDPFIGTKHSGEYQWTNYREFGEMVADFRGALASMGVEAGDTVAVIADNRIEWAVGAYATYSLGAKYCPMYEAQLVKDWKYIIGDSGSKVVLVADTDIYDKVTPLIDELDDLERVVYFDGPQDSEDAYPTLMEHGAKNRVDAVHPDPDDLCGFIYTSGTTGKPKGVLLSHSNLLSVINGVQDLLDIGGSDDVSLSFLPWAHSFGQVCELHALFAFGASMGLAEDVTTIVENLSEVRPTLLFSVPRIFNRIYDGVHKKMDAAGGIKKMLFDKAMANAKKVREAKDAGNEPGFLTQKMNDFYDSVVFSKVRDRFGGRLKYAFSGGAALSPEVARFIDSLNITVYEGYGLTETSPLATLNYPGNRKIGSVGKPIAGVELSIRPVEGYPEGTGEVCIKGPNVMQGYHNLPEKTEAVLDDDGTFRTGDLGRIDDDGFLWILGRVKEQYKLENGKYVVPGPIEEQLKLSPFINQVMIEGTNKPHNVALIVVDEESLVEWCEKNQVPRDEMLEHHKVRQLFRDEIERVSSGIKGYEKPEQFALLDEEWTPENDMLTPTLKLKRRVVMEEYGDLIEALYEGERGAAA